MIPITIKMKSFFPWLVFGLRETVRILTDFCLGRGPREKQLVDFVEANAKKNDPEDVLRTIDIFAKKRFLMNVGQEKGQFLEKVLNQNEARQVLELGCYCGYSALITAQELQKTNGKLISIEKSPLFAQCARRILRHAGLQSYVDIQIGSAEDLIPTLKVPFDVVFIDHWKDAYLPDLRSLEKANLLNNGCTVVADNVGIFENTLTPYLHYVRKSGNYRSKHHSAAMEYFDAIDDGVEISTWLGNQCASSTL